MKKKKKNKKYTKEYIMMAIKAYGFFIMLALMIIAIIYMEVSNWYTKSSLGFFDVF